ncbi:MAG: extracellular solute-binding protein [Leucobacter sp.]
MVTSNIGKRRSRAFLAMGALGASFALVLTGCTGGSDDGGGEAGGDPWRQFEGTEINFISENTAPSAAIAANLEPFEELTGITVNVQQMELDKVAENVLLDLSSGDAQYEVIYADPYQILAPMVDGLADLNEFIEDDSFPEVEGGVEDFIPAQLEATGRYLDEEKLYALPYDAPTLIMMYRADLFEKYGDAAEADLGFNPVPNEEMTWEQYAQVGEWFNENVDEVNYGIGMQSKQHDSLQAEFSNLLWAYGGDYFENGEELGLIGSEDTGDVTIDSPEGVEAATMFKELSSVAHPSSTSWDWTGLGDAFNAGEVAMAVNWHEFAAGAEGAFPEAMGYSVVPKGPERRAANFGGTGIGINGNAEGDQRGAAWLFVNWATSPETQLASLASEVGGGTPTRLSVYDLPEVQEQIEPAPSEFPNIRTAPAVLESWEADNIGLRPKVPEWIELNTIIFTELSKMVTQDGDPAATVESIDEQMTKVMG